MRLLLAALLTGLLIAAPANASTSHTVKRLRAKITRLEKSRDHWRTAAQDARADLQSAQAGLPEIIGTVAAPDFQALILQPAYERWRALGNCADQGTLTNTNEHGTTTVWSIGFHSYGLDDGC